MTLCKLLRYWPYYVIPAKAGIQWPQTLALEALDPRLRGGDDPKSEYERPFHGGR